MGEKIFKKIAFSKFIAKEEMQKVGDMLNAIADRFNEIHDHIEDTFPMFEMLMSEMRRGDGKRPPRPDGKRPPRPDGKRPPKDDEEEEEEKDRKKPAKDDFGKGKEKKKKKPRKKVFGKKKKKKKKK